MAGKEIVILILIIYNVYGMTPNEEQLEDEYIKNHGLPAGDVSYVQGKLSELDRLVAQSLGIRPVFGEEVSKSQGKHGQDILLYTRRQIDFLIDQKKKALQGNQPSQRQRPQQLFNDPGPRRHSTKKPKKSRRKKNKKPRTKKPRTKKPRRGKRKIIDFVQFPCDKWILPIHFKVKDNISNDKKKMILDAVAHWEENTCIRFKQIDDRNRDIKVPYLKFVESTKIERFNDNACASFTGQIPKEDIIANIGRCGVCSSCICPQLIFTEGCKVTGMIIHEIGHAIGLVHEHTRPDRDKFVDIHGQNIEQSKHNFDIAGYTRTKNVPYDVGSVMHYHGYAFGTKQTITTKDPLQQKTMGQRAGLSFYDKQIVDIEYCQGICKQQLQCKRGGFVNPNNCSECTCPDGFGGTLCEKVAPSTSSCPKHPNSKITLNDRSTKCINLSPSSGNVFECNLLLQTHANWKIQIFNVTTDLHEDQHCLLSWGEFKYQNNLESTGVRFCGSGTVRKTMVSDSNEVMVVLKNNAADSKRKFTFCVNAVE